jgi:type IV secretion system protein VirB9
MLSFTYPGPPEPTQEQIELAARETASAAELAAANDPFAVVDPAALNFSWKRSGNDALLPVRVYDDGNATFLTWPSDRAVPAILIKDHEGTEGPVNFTVRGETIIVQGVPPEIVLRSGEDAALLQYTGPVRLSRPLTDDAALAQVERNKKGKN